MPHHIGRPQLLPFYELISLGLYSAMLVTTVLTLKKGYYKYQMGQLAWTITTIVITVVQVTCATSSNCHAATPKHGADESRPLIPHRC